MRKTCGLLLTTALLLGVTSCTTGTNNSNTTPTPGNANVTPTTSVTPTVTTASPTPTPTSPSPSTVPTTATVKGSNFKWTDDASGTPVTTIKVGGSVTWTIVQGRHRLEGVASANGCQQPDASFNSGDLTNGQSVTRTFPSAGTFGYRCGIHGGTPNCNNPSAGDEMWGIIKVVP